MDVRGVPGQSRSNINLRNWPPRPRTTPEPAGRGDSPPGPVAVGHARCSDQSLPEQGAHRQMVSLRLDWMVATACTENPTVFVIYSFKKDKKDKETLISFIILSPLKKKIHHH